MNKKSQFWTLLAVTLVLSLLLAACGGAGKGGETIKIGAALCLTGIQAPLEHRTLHDLRLRA